jgi:mevalonate kinase
LRKKFYSNGKLLITAEYLVLDGAKALALPTKFGQNLEIENGFEQKIVWKSYDADDTIWFEASILFSEIIHFSEFEISTQRTTLISILHHAYLKNPKLLSDSDGYFVTTNLTFPKFWGLGTSSTLINNIAQWFEIDAFELLKNSFGGSGYDIACAQNNFPILYQLENNFPTVEIVNFEPECVDNLYFVYLNQKQNSKSAIASYYKKNKNREDEILKINAITDAILINNNFDNLSEQLQLHENTMSAILQIPTIKLNLFSDFDGVVKSLGAWGGDFVLVISKENPTNYFKEKGFETILNYPEMIL